MRSSLLVGVLLTVAACGGGPSSEPDVASAAPGVLDGVSPTPAVARADVPDVLTVTLSESDSALADVRTLRCELVSPRDIGFMELRFPGLDVPSGWNALPMSLPFPSDGIAIRRATRYAWSVDLHRTSSSAPESGDVRLRFGLTDAGGRNAEVASNVLTVRFPSHADPHVLRADDVHRAAQDGFLLRIDVWSGEGRDRSVCVRPDGRVRVIVLGPPDQASDRTGTLDPEARAEIATVLATIDAATLLTAPSEEFQPRSLGVDTLVTVSLLVGDGFATRDVLGSTFAASAEWRALRDVLGRHLGVHVPALPE